MQAVSMLKTSHMNNSVAARVFLQKTTSERCCGVLSGVMNGLGSLCGQSLFGSEVEKKAPLFSSRKKGKSQKKRERERPTTLGGNVLMCEEREICRPAGRSNSHPPKWAGSFEIT